jgi:hypothetical protein
VHGITVLAVKNAIREGLKLAKIPARLRKIQKLLSLETVKKVALTFCAWTKVANDRH